MSRRCFAALLAVVACAGACRNEGGGRRPPRTRAPEVDAVICAVYARDADALAAMVDYKEWPCRPNDVRPDGTPLCAAAGVPEGGMVERLVVHEGKRIAVPKAEVPAYLGGLLAQQEYELYGVLRWGPNEFMIDYMVLFSGTEAGKGDLGFVLSRGKILAGGATTIDPSQLFPPDDRHWLVRPR